MLKNLTINSLTVCHLKQPVLQNIALELPHREFVVILGPSGSGKTTLLKSVAGLEENICRGEIFIDGNIFNKKNYSSPFKENKIAMVFQDHGLFPHMTARENITFPLKAKNNKNTKKNNQQYINKILEKLQLSEMQNKYPYQLSGGQCQRVSLARALAARPKILLLDEPFASQDPQLKNDLIRNTLEIIRDQHITTLMVTHDQNEAFALECDRLAVLENGVLQQFDTPSNVYNYPKNPFVAQFIGRGSFFDAVLKKNKEKDILDAKFFQTSQFINPSQKKIVEGEVVNIFLRPEDIEIVEKSDIKAKILSCAFYGANHLYHVSVKGWKDKEISLLCLACKKSQYSLGSSVCLSIKKSHIIAFKKG